MLAAKHPRPLAAALRRLLALGCAGLVLAMSVFAASPAAHELLHDDDDHAASEHTCAVVMFANGISLDVAPFALVPPTSVPQGVSPVTAADVFLVSPRYLRQPERGPPSSWVG